MSDARLTKRLHLDREGAFELQVIEDDDRHWLRLSRVDDAVHFVAFWSLPRLSTDAESIEQVAEQLHERLADRSKNIDDATRFWPRGWDYWGRMVPAPLRGYVVSKVFEREFQRIEPSSC